MAETATLASETGAAPVPKDESDTYIKTQTHNFVSRSAIIENPRQVELKGRSIVDGGGCTVRGDLAAVRIGRYCRIQTGTVLQPAEQIIKPDTYVPLTIGSHTQIGRDCHIQAASIGSQCWIGDRVRLGKRVILKDCCVIADDVVLGDDTVVAPFTRVAPPARMELQWTTPAFLEMPPSTAIEMQERSMATYQAFAALQSALQRSKATR